MDARAEQDIDGGRRSMVVTQLLDRGIRDQRVLSAMDRVPRHLFVPADLRHAAYGDHPLPVGHGQTISQPYMVGLMLEVLQLSGAERVLEVGAGSGYQAALLGELADEAWSVETVPALARQAQANLRRAGATNVHVVLGDGSLGWADAAPYDAIVVAAGAPAVPRPLVDQLRPGGRLVIPVGGDALQSLRVVHRAEGGDVTVESIASCSFVPLRGAEGWDRRGAAH